MELSVPRSGVREIEEVEPALKAALGDVYRGMSMTPKSAKLFLAGDASEAMQGLAAQTFQQAAAAIDRQVPPPSIQREMKRRAHALAIASVDILTQRQQTAAANSVPALRAEVDALWLIIERLLALMDINQSEIGE